MWLASGGGAGILAENNVGVTIATSLKQLVVMSFAGQNDMEVIGFLLPLLDIKWNSSYSLFLSLCYEKF